jgi:hypothetical protein
MAILGSIEVNCDSPPYGIVRATRVIGMQSPEDVRWCKSSHCRRQFPRLGYALRHPWRMLRMMCGTGTGACVCGRALPLVEPYSFQMASGRQDCYRIGQCSHCRTIFWDDL